MPRNLTEEKFEIWKGNEFYHLVETCNKIGRRIARIDGILWVVVPLLVALLILSVEILKNGT